MPEDLPHDVADRVRSVLRGRTEVVFAYLFGSRAGDGAHGASDVDVAVYLSDDVGRGGLETWSAIHGDLVEALASSEDGVGRRHRGHAPEGVDLVILNDAPPLLTDRVIRGGELLFSRSEPERLRWTVRQKSRYCDLRPLRRRLDGAVSERLRTGRFGRRGSSPPEGGDGRVAGSRASGGSDDRGHEGSGRASG